MPEIPKHFGDRNLFREEIEQAAAEMRKFIDAHREHYVKAWMAATGDVDPREACLIERQVIADGRVEVHVHVSRRSPETYEQENAELRRTIDSWESSLQERMSALLDMVERPALVPEGAPGSIIRRAWEIGRRLHAIETGTRNDT